MHIEIIIALVILGTVLCVIFATVLTVINKRKPTLKHLRIRCVLATELMSKYIPDSKKPGTALLNGGNILLNPGCVYFYTYEHLPSYNYIQQLAHELKRIGCINRYGISLRLAMDDLKYPVVESMLEKNHVTVSIPISMAPDKLAAFIYHFIK